MNNLTSDMMYVACFEAGHMVVQCPRCKETLDGSELGEMLRRMWSKLLNRLSANYSAAGASFRCPKCSRSLNGEIRHHAEACTEYRRLKLYMAYLKGLRGLATDKRRNSKAPR
jgi:phage FluMu protein Com